METGLYKRLENKFSDKIRYLIKETPSFLKDNYLFLCLLMTFLWFFCTFYPGTVAYDSFQIYSEAYYNRVGTWHSALLTRVWQCILFFTDIRCIFVFIQLSLIFLGLYIIGKNISKGIFTGIICSLILFIPPVFADLFVVIKDSYLAAFIFFISALLIDRAISDKKKTKIFFILSGIVLVFCCYIRSNGSFIAVPLLVALLMGWKAPIIYRYISCLVLVLCVITTTSFVDLKLLKAEDQAPDFSLMLFDVIGTARNSGQTTLPDIPGVPDQMALIKHCYTPLQWDTIAYWEKRDNCNGIAKQYYDKRYKGPEVLQLARKELRKAWISAITHHPLAYLKHRISHFNRFIDYQGYHPAYRPVFTWLLGFVDFGEKQSSLTYQDEKRSGKIWYDFYHQDLGNQLWFHPYVSLLILLFFYLSTLSTSDRFNRALNVVSFAGLIYLVGFLFVGVSSDFRYSYPSLLLSILCILAAFGYYSQKRQLFGTKTTRIIAASVTVPLFLIGIIL